MADQEAVIEKLKSCVARVLSIDIRDLDERASMDNLATWDSLNYLAIVNEVEQTFDFKMTREDMVRATSLANLERIVRSQKEVPK